MTNQEAVARIKDHKAIHKMDEPRAIYISEALDMAIEALENQKTGHWKDCGEREPWYRCSECGEKMWGSYYKYCPHCGVKMKGENK